ncbi:copine, putative [Perkinsus marinus ATCC 50983]|uniref:Copine, putative n=1 Tax=Perkinsus marinus (strain ATCC 50983 / TXsc) TaxID=423536 RepID=C5L3T8_PERM5|nr:copine, putative [Perkinsus marinus ATCC 50983]EER08667.1 copine, putative [Perkinsus marinus ATCC 50983]|eukprot:XP_002776851.1 copine, putative [Perkinsus marinus ATCC 50983]
MELKIACSGLQKRSYCRVKVYQKAGAEKYRLVGKTEIVPDTQNPTFAQGIFLDFLFELFQVIDQKRSGNVVGSGSCVLADLESASQKKVALDFTLSNGDPNRPESLHYYDPRSANDYAMAIRSVGEILEHYDRDKKYPVYGFGAKLPPDYTHTSHLFACNGNYFRPEVVGVDGILDAYRKALKVVHLHGPTMFSEVNETNQRARYAVRRYFVLLIITDGVIVDLQASINAIVDASKAPLSIIIVGVGDQDLGLMDVLDADDHPLVSSFDHSTMDRDIVQFVPFNEFKDKPYTELAMATLDEIPREIVNYYYKNLSDMEFLRGLGEMLLTVSTALAARASEDNIGGPFERFLNHLGPKPRKAFHRKVVGGVGAGTAIIDGDLIRDAPAPVWIRTESGMCKVCFENTTNTTLLPCKHQCMCFDCATGVRDSSGKCPLCRQDIDAVIEAIHS